MTLDKLYELVILKLIYGSLRVDKELGPFRATYNYYGVHSGISLGTVVIKCYSKSCTLITSETNILITKYENSHEC